jgi:hypothetical protein
VSIQLIRSNLFTPGQKAKLGEKYAGMYHQEEEEKIFVNTPLQLFELTTVLFWSSNQSITNGSFSRSPLDAMMPIIWHGLGGRNE